MRICGELTLTQYSTWMVLQTMHYPPLNPPHTHTLSLSLILLLLSCFLSLPLLPPTAICQFVVVQQSCLLLQDSPAWESLNLRNDWREQWKAPANCVGCYSLSRFQYYYNMPYCVGERYFQWYWEGMRDIYCGIGLLCLAYRISLCLQKKGIWYWLRVCMVCYNDHTVSIADCLMWL